MTEDKQPPPTEDASDISVLSRKLQDIDLQLQTLLAGDIDAVIGPSGESYLLRQAQLKLLGSEREQRELALQLETERARLVAAQSVAKIGSWSFDVRSRAVEWSDEMHRIYGTDASHFQPTFENVLELTHPDDRAAQQSRLLRSLGQVGGNVLDHRLSFADGSAKFVEERWEVERDARGESIRAFGTCQDITERRQDEQALRASQAQLSMASRLGRIGAWSLDLSQSTLAWSDLVCAVHDVPAGTTPTLQQALNYYTPEARSSARRAVQACTEHGTPFDLELEITSARGQPRVVRAMGEAVRDSAGVIRLIQGAFQDLSERKEAERELHRLAARLTNTLESITVSFYTVDRDWKFTYFNVEAERMWARRREQVIGKDLWDEFPEFLGSEFEACFRSAMATDTSPVLEAVYPGTTTWMRISVHSAEEGLSIYLRDVTAERAEHRQLKLLEASVAGLNDMVMITEASPLEEPGPRIRFVNEALVHTSGYTRAELLGRSPRLLQGPLTDRAELQRIRDALSRFEPVQAEVVNYTKSGDPYWLELAIVPVAAEGRGYSHFVAVQRDMTERKRDQEALRELNLDLETRVRTRTVELIAAREEAEHANSAKSIFLANMSHEIRTPMNGVIGLLDVLSQSGLQANQAEMAHLIRDSAELLLNIIDDVLDFSKIEAGKLRIENAPLRLAEVVERVCGLLDSMAISRNVGLTVFVDPQIPETVSGDEFRLRQILINLIGNSIKFSGERDQAGRVAVRVRCVEQHPGAVTLELIVADNGIGMDSNTLARLFVPFSQADESTTRRFGGTGLGLAITRTIVRLLGGDITVRSAPAQGTVFTVRLPFGVAADAPSVASPDVLVAGLQCLIVGADAQLADDVSHYLSHAGATVERSPDLEAARQRMHDGSRWLWLVLPDEARAALRTLQEQTAAGPDSQPQCVIFGRGRRRQPRIDDRGLVTIDMDALTRQGLFRSLALAVGRIHAVEPRAVIGALPATATVPPDGVARAWRGPILIAEDNATNREVIRRQLQLLGFTAEMTRDGQQALQRWRDGEFPLLLTDLRMPVMDGYALAAAIRAEEPRGQRTAILALTANALPEEEQRCRAVGMDDYLVKPVKLARLQSAIERWIPAALAPEAPDAASPVDLSVLKELVGDDPADIRAVLKTFRATADRIGGELRRSIAAGAMVAVLDCAHTLKSAAYSIGGARLARVCAEIEQAAESGRTDELAPLSGQLQEQLDTVRGYLDSLGTDLSPLVA